jgi:hypothetical protein
MSKCMCNLQQFMGYSVKCKPCITKLQAAKERECVSCGKVKPKESYVSIYSKCAECRAQLNLLYGEKYGAGVKLTPEEQLRYHRKKYLKAYKLKRKLQKEVSNGQ